MAEVFVGPKEMKLRILVLISIVVLFGCSKNKSHEAQIRRSALMGIWWSPQMFQSAAFQIKDSTIYYPDDLKEYRYELRNDTLLVYQDDGNIVRSVVLRITADTLVLMTQGSEEIYTHSETPIP